jgi:mannose-6-phosphate isomerase-like protein (cupin superfamily)
VEIVHTDEVINVPAGSTPQYNSRNPLSKLLGLMQRVQFAAPRQFYLSEQTQYLLPIADLVMYGPSGADHNLVDPTQQDNKTDFQKQNVADFHTTDTFLVRGLAAVGDWIGPYLRISYRGGPDSKLSQASGHTLGADIRVRLTVGDAASQTLVVPYNLDSDRYELEIWAYPDTDLTERLGDRGKAAIARGELIARPDIVRGCAADFARERLDGKDVTEVAPDNAMHPLLPLTIGTGFTDSSETFWDVKDGADYTYQFNMVVRGWQSYLSVGMSPTTHGGIGTVEYRNLVSSYGRFAGSHALDRTLMPWNLDAFGRKGHNGDVEPFMAVHYMDLHLVMPGSGIGLHRHRDNQEAFFLINGNAFMVVGDWCKMDSRERCMEIRTLPAGHCALLKGGNLHALMNPSDEQLSVLMFGGYD